MELVEKTIENGLYSIFLPRNYYIKTKFLHGNTGTRYYFCSNENGKEKIHGIIYFGIDQNEHKIRFSQNTIIESIETILFDDTIVWPMFFTEENYFTVITQEYKIGAFYRLIRIEGKEKTKEDLINLIKILTTLRKN
jgi:hypothetical protein